MAKVLKRAASKPKSSKGPKKKTSAPSNDLGGNLVKIFFGISLLMLLVLLGIQAIRHYVPSDRPGSDGPPVKTAKEHTRKPAMTVRPKPPAPKPLPFEIYPKEAEPSGHLPEQTVASSPHKIAKLAIIIDDIGDDRNIASRFIALDGNLTLSVLPHGRFRHQIAEAAKSHGMEIMLHLPMEPDEYPHVNPGPGALLVSMAPDVLLAQLTADLDAVPGIKGVNNHMGSRLTTESAKLYQIFSILRKRGLYFVDSRTTAQTLCRSAARLLQVPFAERNVFLDNIQSTEDIAGQIELLKKIARSRGEAIGIGHPYPITYEVLKSLLPEILKDFSLVPPSRLVSLVS